MSLTVILALAGGLAIAGLAVAAALWFGRRRRYVQPAPAPGGWRDVGRQLLLAAPIRLWALILAGPPLTLFAIWVVHLVRFGWPADRAPQQLEILGFALYGVLVLIGVIVISLAAVKLEAETKLGKLSIGGEAPDPASRPAPPPLAGGAP